MKKKFFTLISGKSCVLLSLVQEFVEIEAWLLLAFSFCLHNQISSINFIDTSQEKGYSSNRQNKEWLLLSAGFMLVTKL